jgi:hypothetical protein
MDPSDTFHSCSCAGLNENCYRCAGTGIAGTAPGKPGAPLTEGGFGCPPPPYLPPANIDSIYCSLCKVRFNSLYWRKHLRTVHDSARKNHAYRGGSARAASLSRCTLCGRNFPTRKLADHIRRMHPSRFMGLMSATLLYADSPEARMASITNDRQERFLDQTKNCGFPCREGGRYGSYPSHDGFDDESKP